MIKPGECGMRGHRTSLDTGTEPTLLAPLSLLFSLFSEFRQIDQASRRQPYHQGGKCDKLVNEIKLLLMNFHERCERCDDLLMLLHMF
jgi:hypothetical protein